MRGIDVLKQKVYATDAFCIRGRRKELEDSFLVMENHKAYVLFIILDANLDGTNRHYSYSLYSLQDDCLIEKDDPVFQSLMLRMPALENANKMGGNINPITMFELQDEYYVILEKFIQNFDLTEAEKKQYQDYLEKMQAMQSPSYAAIYQASKELL